MCNYINAHEELIQITSFREYREVMRNVMRVIKEAHNTEKKRRQSSQQRKSEEVTKRTQRAKALISCIKRGKMKTEEIKRNMEVIFGKGSSHEINGAVTNEKIIERIEVMSKTDEQFEVWEKMRKETKRKQREDKRLNVFWRRNKTFPARYNGTEDDTPEVEETLAFWKNINNKSICEGWLTDEDIQEALKEVRSKVRGRCRWDALTEEEFDEVLRCTAPWKACGVDSVYSFPIKK